MTLPPLFNKGFPNYSKETVGDVDVYWYQGEFTQSHYPPGQESELLMLKKISSLLSTFVF